MNESTAYLLEKLEALLTEGFAAEGAGLEAKWRSVAGELPDDLRALLAELADAGRAPADALDFAFRCGQAYERLDSLAQSRLAANIAFLGTDGSPPPVELEANDLDALARFVNWRDQVLRIVADYTLKFLLVSAILLLLGLILGLV